MPMVFTTLGENILFHKQKLYMIVSFLYKFIVTSICCCGRGISGRRHFLSVFVLQIDLFQLPLKDCGSSQGTPLKELLQRKEKMPQ